MASALLTSSAVGSRASFMPRVPASLFMSSLVRAKPPCFVNGYLTASMPTDSHQPNRSQTHRQSVCAGAVHRQAEGVLLVLHVRLLKGAHAPDYECRDAQFVGCGGRGRSFANKRPHFVVAYHARLIEQNMHSESSKTAPHPPCLPRVTRVR